jgi:hypothetical protein
MAATREPESVSHEQSTLFKKKIDNGLEIANAAGFGWRGCSGV